MILQEYIEIFINNKNIDFFRKKGYTNLNMMKKSRIKCCDLTPNCKDKILVKCDDCGSEKELMYASYHNSITIFRKYFCNKCVYKYKKNTSVEDLGEERILEIQEKRKETCIEKYGVDNPNKVEEFKEKSKITNLERYGTENVFQNEEIKDKIKQYYKDNFGVEHNSQIDYVKEKVKNTFIEKYGVESILQNEEIKEKIRNTNQERYGVKYSLQNKEILNKMFETNLERYGVENVSKNEEIKDKIKKTNLERYGVENYFSNKNFINNRSGNKNADTLEKYNNLIDKNRYKIVEYTENRIFTIIDNHYHNIFEISYDNFYHRITNNIELSYFDIPFGLTNQSSKEKEVQEFIKSLNIEFETSNKSILNGKEIDIYIPSKNIGIEYNGLYWHSEINRNSNYHQAKSLQCIERGIQLIHIWEDEWNYKKDIVKSIIKDKLGINGNIIYARKTILKEVGSSNAMNFLNENHIQGGCGSNIKLGLYYNNELVSLMTFGYRFINSKKEYELLRFCNKINTKIIGGASKLFNYFINNFYFDIINSYSDLSISHGKLYESLGFKYSHLSKPDYFWVVNNIRKHRFNYNKKKLIKEGYDSTKTEKEIMYERGYYRIFCCGQMKWIYTS